MAAPASKLHLLVSRVSATRSRFAMLVEPSIAVLRPKLPATSQPQSLGRTPLTPAVHCHVSVSGKTWHGPGSARRRLRCTMSSPVGLVGLVAGSAKFNGLPGRAVRLLLWQV